MRSRRGSVIILVLIALALGGTLFVTAPRFLHGDSRRADTSTATTEALNKATESQGASAAAYVQKIGEAAATSPESRERQFILAAVPVAMSYLPGADPKKLIEAERLKVAIMEGRLAQANVYMEAALKDASESKRETTRALAAKRASDANLERVAAERLGAERVSRWAVWFGVTCLVLFTYVKLTHLSPGALAEAVVDIKNKAVDPIHALDSVTTRTQQSLVSFLAKLR